MTVVIPSSSAGVRYDTSPIGLKKNWVTEAGGLPDFVRAVAHALIRSGHPESGAIQMAIGVIKNWAEGKGKVHADTRAKAVATVAHWEAMKASTGRSIEEELEYRATGAFASGHAFEGNQYMTGANAPVQPATAGQQLGGLNNAQVYILASAVQAALGQKVTGTFTESQLGAVKSAMGAAGAKAAAGSAKKAGAAAKAAASKMAAAQKAQAAKAAQAAAAAKAAAAKTAAVDKAGATAVSKSSTTAANTINGLPAADRQSLSSSTPPAGFAWGKGADGTPTLVPTAQGAAAANNAAASAKATAASNAAASLAKQQAASASKPATASSEKTAASVNAMSPSGRQGMANTVPPAGFSWGKDENGDPILVLAHRDAMGSVVTETGSAGALLPVGQPRLVKPRQVQTIGPHKFKGSDLASCSEPGCSKPITDPVHSRPKAGKRDAMDPASSTVGTQKFPISVSRHMGAAKTSNRAAQDRLAEALHRVITKHFSDQRKSTLARLGGKRGAQMLRRAAQPPEFPDGGNDPEAVEPPPEVAAGANPAAVDPTAIFDDAFWANQLADTLETHFGVAAATAVGQVKHQVGAPVDVADKDSLGAVDAVLAARAKSSAMQVTETTRKAIFEALQQGMANGEGIGPLTDRINAIFDSADSDRAHMIAQTEAVGALNQAATTYMETLPEGIVGGKMWLSHHDGRTRPTHRLADGQIVPVGKKFWVGGFPMNQPGDQTAPPGETINCRCGVAGVSPDMAAPLIGVSKLEGLVPSSTLAALDKIQQEQADNRTKLEAETAAAAMADA